MSWSGRSCGVTSGRAIEQVGAAAAAGRTGKTVIKPIGAKRAAAKKPVKRQRTKS